MISVAVVCARCGVVLDTSVHRESECPSEVCRDTRILKAARLRLLRLGGAAGAMGWCDPVEYAEARSRACDARAALSLAGGADPDDIDPASGCWDGAR